MDDAERITRLEEEVAYLRNANEELSTELHAHWKQFEALKKQMGLVEARLSNIQDGLETPVENTRPPHW